MHHFLTMPAIIRTYRAFEVGVSFVTGHGHLGKPCWSASCSLVVPMAVDGFSWRTDAARPLGAIAVVFQNDRLLPWRTAIGNVELGLEMLDVPKETRRDIAQHWLSKLGLNGHEKDYPHALSDGMRQRVSIARAFATDANLLLCDEPFSALDEMTGQRLRNEFANLVRENNKTAVFITHAIDEALQLGDRIVVLKRPAKIAYETKLGRDTPVEQRENIRSRIREVLAA